MPREAAAAAGGPAAPEPELTLPDQPGARPGRSTGRRRSSPRTASPSCPARWPPSPAGRRRPPRRLGYPVVVKLAADGIEHKSDIGGVKIGLGRTRRRSRAAYAEVVAAGRAAGADVQRRARPAACATGGIELLVGVVTDPAWGQVLAVGLGGVWVEILRDTALQRAPGRPRPGPAGAAQPARRAGCSTARAAPRRPTWTRSPTPSPRSPTWPCGSATAWRRWRSTRCSSAAPRSRRSTRSSPGASPSAVPQGAARLPVLLIQGLSSERGRASPVRARGLPARAAAGGQPSPGPDRLII